MGLVVIGGLEAGSVVLDDYFDILIRLPRGDGNVDGGVTFAHAVYDGVFDDGLQSQWRQAEQGVLRVEIDEEGVFKLRHFHGEVSAGVLQLFGEGYGSFLGDGGEIFPQITVEVQNDLLCFLWILTAETVNASQGVMYEMRSHLQYGNFSPMQGKLLAGSYVMIRLVAEDKNKHEHG